jgi:hypothetical protein
VLVIPTSGIATSAVVTIDYYGEVCNSEPRATWESKCISNHRITADIEMAGPDAFLNEYQ